MSPARFRCANSLGTFGLTATKTGPDAVKTKSCGGSGYRSRFSTLRRLYATMYNNPPSASFGTRTRTYTLEGCNSTLKLRMHPTSICKPRARDEARFAVHSIQLAAGWMAEWSKALDSSSSLFGGVGSNPTSTTTFFVKPGRPQRLSQLINTGHPSRHPSIVPPSSVGRAQDF